MNNVFTVKSSSDWHLPTKSCLINFSLLQETACAAPFRSFSIKYVADGNEKYIVNGNKYIIQTGQYLLANHFSEGFVEIDKPVRGICIDVAPDVLSEVVASYRRPDTPFSDLVLDTFFNTSDFLDNKYQHTETHLGKFLHQFDTALISNPQHAPHFSREFYFTLAEKILVDHIPIYKQLQSIHSIKSNTKKDLLRRLMQGKAYIDVYFQQNLEVATIARESNLSEYHFFRLFKSVFGISPYQYILQKRLDFASNLIKQGNYTISDVAIVAGFSDIYAFSKSFKNYFGIAPSFLQKC